MTLEIILPKKSTELVLLFREKTTKLVFLWPNMSQRGIKVLKCIFFSCNYFFTNNEPKFFEQEIKNLTNRWKIKNYTRPSFSIFKWLKN